MPVVKIGCAPNAPTRKAKGTVYLIHFDTKYKHAAHYIGFTKRLSPLQRLRDHRANRGARLLQVLNAAGIGYHIARTWPGSIRDFERALKNRKHPARFCPYCKPELKKNRYRLHKK